MITTRDSVPLLLRLPGLRRYAIELARLRKRVSTAEDRLQAARARLRAARLWDKELAAVVSNQRRELKKAGERWEQAAGDNAQEMLRKAMRFDYYWVNAAKKIDLRAIDGFGPLARQIREENRTYLDLDRLYTLWQGVSALPADATAIAEVGTYKGGSAKFMAEAMRAAGRELPFYVADTFEGHVEVDETIDTRHRVGAHFQITSAEGVGRYLRHYPFVRLLAGDIRATSVAIKDETRLGLVHIDVDVYPITRFCLEFFAPRMVRGAMMVVDDYGFTTCPGAKQAVDEFAAAHKDFRLLHLLTGQAVLIPTAAP